MVYAKLYPRRMIEEYRKAVRGLYNAYHGEESLKTPTLEGMGCFCSELQHARHGNPSLRAANGRLLSERARLPRL
jgi:hypothetical protein